MEANFETEEQLLQLHRKEKKDLQAKIQALKKTAIKGDKKKKKEVQEEIAKLEADLQTKHSAELSALPVSSAEEPKLDILEDFEEITLKDSSHKVSKAQKRRKKKDQLSKERDQRIAEQEIENETGDRNLEAVAIKEKLKSKGLMIYNIPSDGDCLFAAVNHALGASAVGVPNLRKSTSSYVREHKNDYLPFLCDPNTGDLLNDEQFASYCDKIQSTKQWGGQVELDALAHVVRKSITVVQAEGQDLVMGEQYAEHGKLVLSYHRHLYRLGAHYNSVQVYVPEPDI